jgi:hypothetical protein
MISCSHCLVITCCNYIQTDFIGFENVGQRMTALLKMQMKPEDWLVKKNFQVRMKKALYIAFKYNGNSQYQFIFTNAFT